MDCLFSFLFQIGSFCHSNMMMKLMNRIFIYSIILFFASCTDSEDEFYDLKYEPQSVFVKTKAFVLTPEMFKIINRYDFQVEVADNAFYVTELPGDRLEEILDDLNTRAYVNDGVWKATGYLHALNGKIHVFTRLFDIKNKDNQRDWLALMEKYHLKENFIFDHSGFMIHFKVHTGEEKRWVKHFRNLNFVEWAELNYYVPIVTHD
jgi:hypothetical protein